MTNRDVINHMTDAELGRFLNSNDRVCVRCAYYDDNESDYGCSMMKLRQHATYSDSHEICTDGMTKWLSQTPDFRMQEYFKDDSI